MLAGSLKPSGGGAKRERAIAAVVQRAFPHEESATHQCAMKSSTAGPGVRCKEIWVRCQQPEKWIDGRKETISVP
jgi:hypothetical protein